VDVVEADRREALEGGASAKDGVLVVGGVVTSALTISGVVRWLSLSTGFLEEKKKPVVLLYIDERFEGMLGYAGRWRPSPSYKTRGRNRVIKWKVESYDVTTMSRKP